MGSSAGTLRKDNGSGKNSRRIDAELEKEKDEKKFKILLLGGSEILHLNGFSPEQLAEYKSTIHRNCVESLQQLLAGCELFKYGFEISAQEDAHRFREYARTVPKDETVAVLIPVAIMRVMERLWATSQVQAAYLRRFKFPLLDCARHFLDSLSRIGEPDYCPSTQDVVMCRYRTKGVAELNFAYKKINFQMVDVGGQRTERRKWIHCFDNVDMLIFVISLSDFDMTDPEDERQNRFLQNFEIFKTIISSGIFRHASIVLFMNKYDLFTEKIQSTPLKKCFPMYDGDNSEEDATNYLRKTFARYIKNKHRFFPFTTQATDTDHIDRYR